MQIRLDDLSGPEIHALLEEHLASMHEISPPESVHALDLSELRRPEITFWTVWSDGTLLGCGALKELDPTHGEVKSMRTAAAHRGKGVARAVLSHIFGVARERKYTRLSLETGSFPEFAPARRLYESFGFQYCAPFAKYNADPNSVFMTRAIAPQFEAYVPRSARTQRRTAPRGLRIRPATSADINRIAQIEAQRAGGDPADFEPSLEQAIASSVAGERLILVAEHDRGLAGFGKIGYLRPAADAPPNIAPRGWYLTGIIVEPEYRGRGIGRQLTKARMECIAERDREAFYFANARNQVSIDLHREFGFVELTRNFTIPRVTFEGGVGILFRAVLSQTRRFS